jgi:hypothetical protein
VTAAEGSLAVWQCLAMFESDFADTYGQQNFHSCQWGASASELQLIILPRQFNQYAVVPLSAVAVFLPIFIIIIATHFAISYPP